MAHLDAVDGALMPEQVARKGTSSTELRAEEEL